MSTATATVPADVITQAHAALHEAMGVVRAALAVDDALEVFEAIASGALHWEFAWPHLRDEADPHGAALMKAAEEVESAGGDLIAALAAHGGTEGNLKFAVAGVTTR